MHRNAMYASNEVQRLLKVQGANLDPTFVKCMGAALNMIKAMRLELFPFHILREDKRLLLLSIAEDILLLVNRFTQQVKSEYDTFKFMQSTLPTLSSGRWNDTTDLTPLLELIEVIKHWKTVLPPLRKASRLAEFMVLDHFSTFYQQAVFLPYCESKGNFNDRSLTSLKAVIDAIALGLEELILAYKRLNDCRVDVEHELEAAFRRVEDIPIEWKLHLYQLSHGSEVREPLSVHAGSRVKDSDRMISAAPQLPAHGPFENLAEVDLIKKFTLHTRLPKTHETGTRIVSTSSQETVTPTSIKPDPPLRSKKRPAPFTWNNSDEDLRPDLLPPDHAGVPIRPSAKLEMTSSANSSSTRLSSSKPSSAKPKSAPENTYPLSASTTTNDLRKVKSDLSQRHDAPPPHQELFPRVSDEEKVRDNDDETKRKDSYGSDMLDLSNSPVDSSNDPSSPTKPWFTTKIKAMRDRSRSRQHKSKRSNTTQSSSSGTSSKSPYVSQHASRNQSRTGLHDFQGSLGSVKEHGIAIPPIPKQLVPALQRTKTEPNCPVLAKDSRATTSFESVGSSDSTKSESKFRFLRRITSKGQINVKEGTAPGQVRKWSV